MNCQLSITNKPFTASNCLSASYDAVKGLCQQQKNTYYKGIVLVFSHFFHIFAK